MTAHCGFDLPFPDFPGIIYLFIVTELFELLLVFWFLTFYLINDLLIFSPVLEVPVLLDCFGYVEAFYFGAI